MMKNSFRLLFLLLVFWCVAFTCDAQVFKWRVEISNVAKSGWHKIVLPPEVLNKSQIQLGDLRLFNSKNVEIPYELRHQNNYFKDSIVFSEVQKESYTVKNIVETKSTQINFEFSYPQLLNRLIFHIDSPAYYYRHARITDYSNENKRRGKQGYPSRTFQLNSEASKTIELEEFRSSHFEIEIQNNDNAPLLLRDVTLMQMAPVMIADLQNNEKYYLKFGNEKCSKPIYDISHFIGNVSSMPLLRTTGLTLLDSSSPVTVNTPAHPWQKPFFIWVCLFIVIALVAVFSHRMLREMHKK